MVKDSKEVKESSDTAAQEVALSAAMSYIPFFSLALINYKKENYFMHYHAQQGLVITILCIINAVLHRILPFISFVFVIINILLLIVIVIGVFAALMGKKLEFPFISEIAGRFII